MTGPPTPAVGTTRKKPRRSPFDVQFNVAAHVGFGITPGFGFAGVLIGNASIVRFGKPSNVEFSVIGGLTFGGGDINGTMIMGGVDLGIALRLGGYWSLDLTYSPGVSMLNDDARWDWIGLHVQIGRMFSRNFSAGSSFVQLGRGGVEPALRIFGAYFQGTF